MRPRPAMATSAAAKARARPIRWRSSSKSRRSDVARQFVASGDYYWNSGMFVFKARALSGGTAGTRARTSSMRQRAPTGAPSGIWISCASTRRPSRHAAASRSTTRSWRRPRMPWCCRSMPAGATSVPGPRCSMRCRRTRRATCCIGDVMVFDTHDCYVHSTSRLVTAVGMDDHIIVETKDAVLVAPKDRVQDVKELVRQAEEERPHRARAAPRGVPTLGQLRQHRRGRALPGQAPVGQAGRRAVAADASPSRRALDRGVGHRTHHLRREDLPAVGEPVDLHSDGRAHRIENPGKVPLHIIEVQSGVLSGRGRHRALRGQLRPPRTPAH